ncbi:MAG: peptidoglycan-binding domain-containing protein [Myxococcota bacterium]|nr:peptidoglycan-binding domain-containing protein [Myxococcota bacterium]
MPPESEACEQWLRDFQQAHGLREDGRLGPATLAALAAVYDVDGGGMGGLIVGGEELELGIPVARMNTLGKQSKVPTEPPTLAVLLSVFELERQSRYRRVGERPIRAHFTIDASQGRDGHSLIIQWADPLRSVGFAPVEEDGDYPRNRSAVGIELDNPLSLHERGGDERRWSRPRRVVSAEINAQRCRQLSFHPEQLASLKRLMAALDEKLAIPLDFPQQQGRYLSKRFDNCANWHGYLARFHYAERLHEPGAGLVEALPQLFGALAEPEQSEVTNPETSPRPELTVSRACPPLVSIDPKSEESSVAWQAPPSSALNPRSDAGSVFSMSQHLRGRRRGSRSRQSRAEALAKRLRGPDEPS